MDQIGEEEPPGRSILTFSSPFLFRMLTTPFIIPRARYCPSFVHLQANHAQQHKCTNENVLLLHKSAAPDFTYPQHVILLLTLCLFTDFCSGDHRPKNMRSLRCFISLCTYIRSHLSKFSTKVHSPKSPDEQEASW